MAFAREKINATHFHILVYSKMDPKHYLITSNINMTYCFKWYRNRVSLPPVSDRSNKLSLITRIARPTRPARTYLMKPYLLIRWNSTSSSIFQWWDILCLPVFFLDMTKTSVKSFPIFDLCINSTQYRHFYYYTSFTVPDCFFTTFLSLPSHIFERFSSSNPLLLPSTLSIFQFPACLHKLLRKRHAQAVSTRNPASLHHFQICALKTGRRSFQHRWDVPSVMLLRAHLSMRSRSTIWKDSETTSTNLLIMVAAILHVIGRREV